MESLRAEPELLLAYHDSTSRDVRTAMRSLSPVNEGNFIQHRGDKGQPDLAG